MTDYITGMIDRRHDRGVASIRTPAVKIIVGHGTPNAGILETLKCCTALMPGYSNEYAIRTHVTESGTHTTNYTASILLMGADENDDISAYASANGTRSEQWRRVESGSSCGVNEAGRSDATLGTSVARIPVSLSFRPNRQYSISYAPPVAYGLSQKNEWTKLQQCANRLANSERNNWYLRPGSVTGGDSQPLRGETDNQLQLSGSTTYEPPGSGVQQRRQVTVTWQLRACEGS